MKNTPAKKILAALLIILFITPVSFFSAPKKAHAFLGAGDMVAIFADFSSTSLLKLAKDTISAVSTASSAASDLALFTDKYVLQPLAFVLSGRILKALTSGIINFINGKTNGTGHAQYVQSLPYYLQTVRDNQALPFISQFQTLSNSPFAPQIASILYRNYTQNSTLAGFFAQNQDTLSRVSPNPRAFVAGNFWGNGGWNAWFSLTTNCNNDPYCLTYKAQNELASLTQNATQDALNQLNWGQGFLSWCGGSAPSTSTKVGTAPGDACTKANGSPGTIRTPGSVIHDMLSQIENANILKFTQLGSLGPEVNTIMKNMSTVMSTVGFASALFGGGSNSGLAGISTAPAGGTSPLSQYANTPGFLGVTSAGIAKSASTFSLSPQQVAANVDQYNSDWTTISNAATAASKNINAVKSTCTSPSVQNEAQTALDKLVAPVLSQAAQAFSDIAATRALIQKVQNDTNGNGSGSSYATDLQALQTAPPSAKQLAAADQESVSRGGASASPHGSLAVSGGSVLDQMNLLAQNANTILVTCVKTATSTVP